MKIPTICRYCGGKIIKSTTRALYPKGSEPIYLCVNCNAYVGCYPEYNGILWNGRCGNPECIYHWHPPEDAPAEPSHKEGSSG